MRQLIKKTQLEEENKEFHQKEQSWEKKVVQFEEQGLARKELNWEIKIKQLDIKREP